MLDETPQPEIPPVALDEFVLVLDAWAEATRKIKELNIEIDKYKSLLAKQMGDATVGTVDGVKVVTFAPIDGFNSTDFKKQYPETARFYTREVTKVEFDKEALKHSKPDLYKEFQTRPMKSTYVPKDQA